VHVISKPLDLAQDEDVDRLIQETAPLDVGLLVCNAAASPIGKFLDVGMDEHRKVIAVNCLAPARLAHTFGRRLVARGRGGIVLVSSLAGLQGTAMVAHYAATKAYLRVLAEGLENELRAKGVDVLAPIVGPVDTPAFRASEPRLEALLPPPGEARAVAQATLKALGHGPRCFITSGERVAALVLERLLPRRLGVELMSAFTRRMYDRSVR